MDECGELHQSSASGLTIVWSGGQFKFEFAGHDVRLDFRGNPTDPTKSREEQFYCNAAASAGSL